jgi:hypothetical protein
LCWLCWGGTAAIGAQSFTSLYEVSAPQITDNFYTIDRSQRDIALSIGYAAPRVVGYIFSGSGIGSPAKPLYRTYIGPTQTEHFYTTSYADFTFVTNNLGYTYEGIEGGLFPGPIPGYESESIPLHRMWKLHPGGDVEHRFATSTAEVNYYTSQGWGYDFVEGYAFSPSAMRPRGYLSPGLVCTLLNPLSPPCKPSDIGVKVKVLGTCTTSNGICAASDEIYYYCNGTVSFFNNSNGAYLGTSSVRRGSTGGGLGSSGWGCVAEFPFPSVVKGTQVRMEFSGYQYVFQRTGSSQYTTSLLPPASNVFTYN